jgi:hypothetical protein
VILDQYTVLRRDPRRVVRKYLKGTIIEPGLTLNQMATVIFELIDGARSIGDIADVIVDGYEVDRATVVSDVIALATQLVLDGALLVAAADEAAPVAEASRP